MRVVHANSSMISLLAQIKMMLQQASVGHLHCAGGAGAPHSPSSLCVSHSRHPVACSGSVR